MAAGATRDVGERAEADTTTLSTRFTAKQREVLEQAATILNCRSAKLIREATLQRAADVINASGHAGVTLRALAHKALQPMVNPLVEIRWKFPHPEDSDTVEEMSLESWEALSEEEQRDLASREPGSHSMEVRPVRPDPNEVRQIRMALKTCPTEFARMMVEQWESVESGGQRYQPKITAAELLGGEGEP